MREIKFRGKICKGIAGEGLWVYWGLSGLDRLDCIDKETIGEFTGLKDKNGKEIYEGDKVQCFNFIYRHFRHEVKYFDGAFGYEFAEDFISFQHNFNFHWENGKSMYIEVVGNVFDNP